MRKRFVHFLPIALIALSVESCRNPNFPEDKVPGLYAQVVDTSGIALPGVGVHYIFYTESNLVLLSAGIQYVLPSWQTVTVTVFDPFGRTLKTLVDGIPQQPGNYVITFDSVVTNGVYSWTVRTGDSSRSGSFLIRDDDLVRLQNKNPLRYTDDGGAFELSNSLLGIGRTFKELFTDETVADSITVVLTKANYCTLVQTVRLSKTQATEKKFVLQR